MCRPTLDPVWADPPLCVNFGRSSGIVFLPHRSRKAAAVLFRPRPGEHDLLRRFATGLIKGRGLAVAETMRRPGRDVRRVPDFLKMTGNARPRPSPARA